MWVKGFFPFPHSVSQKFRVFSRARPRERKGKIERNKYEDESRGGRRGEEISAQRTIQCESFGNPDTAAGPKARAVFIAAPVYGTANLKIHSVRRGRNDLVLGIWTYRWQAKSVRPTPIYFSVRRAERRSVLAGCGRNA